MNLNNKLIYSIDIFIFQILFANYILMEEVYEFRNDLIFGSDEPKEEFGEKWVDIHNKMISFLAKKPNIQAIDKSLQPKSKSQQKNLSKPKAKAQVIIKSGSFTERYPKEESDLKTLVKSQYFQSIKEIAEADSIKREQSIANESQQPQIKRRVSLHQIPPEIHILPAKTPQPVKYVIPNHSKTPFNYNLMFDKVNHVYRNNIQAILKANLVKYKPKSLYQKFERNKVLKKNSDQLHLPLIDRQDHHFAQQDQKKTQNHIQNTLTTNFIDQSINIKGENEKIKDSQIKLEMLPQFRVNKVHSVQAYHCPSLHFANSRVNTPQRIAKDQIFRKNTQNQNDKEQQQISNNKHKLIKPDQIHSRQWLKPRLIETQSEQNKEHKLKFSLQKKDILSYNLLRSIKHAMNEKKKTKKLIIFR